MKNKSVYVFGPIPSHGVGMELQMAIEHKIPVIAIAKKGCKISSMIIGLPALKKTIYYRDIDDLEKRLGKRIEEVIIHAKKEEQK